MATTKADDKRITCGVATARNLGRAGFRAVVWTGFNRPWRGPFRMDYVDAVADAQGHAANLYRRMMRSHVAN